MPTTVIPNSAKVEFLKGAHCTNVTQSSLAGAGVNAAFTITGLTTTADVVVGMLASGTNVAANAIVASIDSLTQVTVSKAHTGTVTSGTIQFQADVFKLALIKVGATGTYDKNVTNAGTPGTGSPTTSNLGTDEIAISGSYTPAGGPALTNVTPILSTDTACGSFASISYTSATISTIGCLIYNTNTRLGQATTYALGANRVIYVGDFGGTQTVTAGTLTLTMPTQNSSTALLRIA
jgi:hypothetical protein